MLICNECNRVFDESEADNYDDDYGWNVENGHIAAYQSVMCCPHCGSEDFEDATECNICSEYFRKDDMILTDGLTYVCPECYAELEDEEDEG